MGSEKNIAVIGLGYVGLPLAIELAKHFDVLGFDINKSRIEELKKGYDRTAEVAENELKKSALSFTNESQNLKGRDIYIVTVPTPITEDSQPDLTPLEKACAFIGPFLSSGTIVVFESTVYPGVTEKICGPLLEKHSGLKRGEDFYLGYSPERINPGDKVHTLSQITKVVAGETPAITDILASLYGRINNNNIHKAPNIMTAEAAKVIENTQRDVNIAFINEITAIFSALNLSIHDVLEAAKTKWNFLSFEPGLVGGHCIGVDPYYLATLARQLNHPPEIILAGRATNEGMSQFIANFLQQKLGNSKKRILTLGLTFKENVPDLRNTKVIDFVKALRNKGHTVDIHDPYADPKEASELYGISLLTHLDTLQSYDGLVLAVPHRPYHHLTKEHFKNLITADGFIFDLKGIWRSLKISAPLQYWTL